MFVRCFVLQTIFNCNFQAVQHTCWRTYTLPRVLLSFFLTLFFRPLISEIPERNSTKIGHMVGSKCSLKTHVQNLGYPLPLQIGGQEHLFWTTSELNSNFYGLCLRNETRYRQAIICVANYEGSPISSQNNTNLGPQTAKIGPPFYPPSINSALHSTARLHRRRSANGTQPNLVKRWTVDRANNRCGTVGVVPP